MKWSEIFGKLFDAWNIFRQKLWVYLIREDVHIFFGCAALAFLHSNLGIPIEIGQDRLTIDSHT